MGRHQAKPCGGDTRNPLEEPTDLASNSQETLLLLPTTDNHDPRILDPAAYEQVRGNVSPPPSDSSLRLRFRVPEILPPAAKWAIEDHDLDTVIWLDFDGMIWEKDRESPAQHSGMIHVSVWWQGAGVSTEAYVNESTRLVVFHKPDGRTKISRTLPADVSTSSHHFYGYFPMKDRARLWFARKTMTGILENPKQNHCLSKARLPGNSSPAAVAENPDFDLDRMRRALDEGLPTSENPSATTPRSGVAGCDSVRVTTEEMKVLVSSAQETRLRRGYLATADEELAIDSAEKRHASRDTSIRPACQLGESYGVRRVPPCKPPGSRERLRANDESLYDHSSSLARLRNELSSSGNDDR